MFEINSRERKKETSLNNFPAFVWLCTQLYAYKSSFITKILYLEKMVLLKSAIQFVRTLVKRKWTLIPADFGSM